MSLYPLKFKPVYKEKIWGGNKIKNFFNRKLPDKKIGESWEITAHPNGVSEVKNGPLKGEKITDLINKNYSEILGDIKPDTNRPFPLLIKILDASQKLSVQVHPDNKYAQKMEGEPGKTEMWYIIQAEPGAGLVYGLKPGTTKNQIKKSVKNGTLENYLNEIKVKAGEVYFIPSGTLHTIKGGILLAEIQQNSDTTYRVYDWDRVGTNGKPRELHLEKALKVINFKEKSPPGETQPLVFSTKKYTRSFLAASPYFVTEKIDINDSTYNLKNNKNKFIILMALQGQGKINYHHKNYKFIKGETVMLPAVIDQVEIKGNLEFLKIYIPDHKSVFVNELSKMNFTETEINLIPGMTYWTEE